MMRQPNRGFANRFVLFVLVAAVAAGLGLVAAQRFFNPDAPAAVVVAPPMAAVRLITPARALSGYQLQRADGSVLTPDTLRGHWTVVFLGFTQCPDVCPTTLAELAHAQKSWLSIPADVRPRVLFVSVDPERDTPAKTGEYAAFFHADTIAATAAPAALENFAQVMGLVYLKVPTQDGSYTMDHSATMVVLDPQGRQAGLIRPPFDWRGIAADLKFLAGQSG